MSLTRVVRAENWWGSKLPPLFALAYAQILLLNIEPIHAFILLFGVLVVTGGSTGAYGHVINDIFDLEVDRRINKKNRMEPFSPVVRGLICCFFVVTALAPAFVLPYPKATTLLVVVELALPALYSIPPVRLKDRAMLGVIADAAGAHIVPALIVVTAFAGGWPTRQPVLVVSIVVWSACLGFKGILSHQGIDREDDLRAGAKTYAAKADPAVVGAILSRYVYPVEVLAFVAIVIVLTPAAPLLLVFFVVSIALDLVKLGLGWSYVFDAREPDIRRRHLPLVSNFFYELGFPLALTIHLVLRDWRFVVLVVVQLVIFVANMKEQVSDFRAVISDMRRRRSKADDWRRWGWYLDVHGSAVAKLEASEEGAPGLRVVVERAGELSWQVKLFRDAVSILEKHSYRVCFEVRADRRRKITYCVVAGSEPWDSLGLSEEIEIGVDWIGVIDRFVAAADDERSEVCLLLGQAEGSIDVRNFSFQMEVRA